MENAFDKPSYHRNLRLAIYRILAVLSVFVIVFGVFYASWRTPYFCDDNTYRMDLLHGPDPCRVSNATGMVCEFDTVAGKALNFVKCVAEFYLKESGRFWGAISAHLFVVIPRSIYGALNGTLFALMCVFVWKLAGLSGKWFYCVIASGVVALFKADSVLWLSASVTYLWPVTFVLGLALMFTSGRLPKTWFMALPCALVAGGHEIVSVPVCIALGVYWLRRIIAEQHVEIDGRVIMTVGFMVGTALIFISPASPLARLHGEYSSSIAYKVLCKVMTLSFCSFGSPFFLPTCVMLVLAVFVRRYRWVFSGRSGWMALLWAVIMLFTLAFGTICARASWPANVMTMLLFFAMLPKFAAGWRPCIKRTTTFAICALAVATLVNTAISSHVHYEAYGSSMADYSSDRNDIYRIPDRCDWLFGFLFDRSVPPLAIVQVADGEDCTNGIFARLLGRRRIIGLHCQEADVVKDPSRFCIPDNRLEGVEGEWYSVPGCDLLVSPMPASLGGSTVGVWRANVEYRDFPPSSGDYVRLMREILKKNLSDNLGGLPILRTMAVFEDSVRDILYTSLYCSRPLKGFELETESGRFLVFVHNHFADREKISAIRMWAHQ